MLSEIPDMRILMLFCLAAAVILQSCQAERKEVVSVPEISYSVHSTLPHDTKAFTQGLVIHEGRLFESTGQEGASWIGEVDIATGIADRKVSLGPQYFGEGIAILNNKVYQLTWKNKTGFVYDLATFRQLRTFSYPNEGWGLTHDGKNLIMSDGSSVLTFLDTATLKPVRTLEVKDANGPLRNLNELEMADGVLYANVWQSTRIARIDPNDGQVTGYMDISIITDQALARNPQADVLNGIAWHPGTQSMLVTGKYWPNIFVLKLKP